MYVVYVRAVRDVFVWIFIFFIQSKGKNVVTNSAFSSNIWNYVDCDIGTCVLCICFSEVDVLFFFCYPKLEIFAGLNILSGFYRRTSTVLSYTSRIKNMLTLPMMKSSREWYVGDGIQS